MDRYPNDKQMRRMAKALERATVHETPFRHGISYLVHPDVCTACTPSLLAIAHILRDPAQVIDRATCRLVISFVTDGSSPFFGRQPSEAASEAARLHRVVVERGRRRGRVVTRSVALRSWRPAAVLAAVHR